MNTDLSPFRFTSVYSADAIVASGVLPWHLMCWRSSANLQVEHCQHQGAVLRMSLLLQQVCTFVLGNQRSRFVMSPVVISFLSIRKTATAADLKMPPPPFSMFTPCPSVVFGSMSEPCNSNLHC